MTQSSEKSGVPVWVWFVGGGCGCGFLGIILIGILAAIALPSFLNQANKARESEAKNYVGAMVRGQQAYFLERNKFTASLADLQIGIAPESTNYSYKITLPPGKTTQVFVAAIPKKPNLKSVAGAAFAVTQGKEIVTVTQMCQTETASATPPIRITAPANANDRPKCPPGSRSIYD
jgi:type IV pilus assembly protein PilA